MIAKKLAMPKIHKFLIQILAKDNPVKLIKVLH